MSPPFLGFLVLQFKIYLLDSARARATLCRSKAALHSGNVRIVIVIGVKYLTQGNLTGQNSSQITYMFTMHVSAFEHQLQAPFIFTEDLDTFLHLKHLC